MSASTARVTSPVAAALDGQVVLVIGGSAGIGLETARGAVALGGSVIITGRDRERLTNAATDVGATSSAVLDLRTPDSVERFFDGLPLFDHVLVSGGGPLYTPIREFDREAALRNLDEHIITPLRIARAAEGRIRPDGSMVLITGTGARRPAFGLSIASAATLATAAVVGTIAIEFAPMRVNAVAPGFVDTPLSARLLGDDLTARRDELRDALPIRRVIGADDVAATILHLMTNTAMTGTVVDIDGGQALVSR